MMLLDDLSQYLSGAGVTASIHKGFSQELPDTAVVLRETGGYPSQHVNATAAGKRILEEPTVQIVARATTYQAAMTLAQQAYGLLDGLRDTTVNTVLYHFVRAMQPPFFLQRDENHRFLCAFNIHVTRRSA